MIQWLHIDDDIDVIGNIIVIDDGIDLILTVVTVLTIDDIISIGSIDWYYWYSWRGNLLLLLVLLMTAIVVISRNYWSGIISNIIASLLAWRRHWLLCDDDMTNLTQRPEKASDDDIIPVLCC